MSTTDAPTHTHHDITTYAEARECYRLKSLRQGQYDEGKVIMSDVVVNLHGDEHRGRRRLENRLFRRDTFLRYERELFPPIIAETVRPHLEHGRSELVSFGHHLMMNLAAFTAGVDRPEGTPAETQRLYDYLTVFIEGATLHHHTGDKAAKAAEVTAALERFDEEFLADSITRRRRLIAAVDAGGADEETLPRDVLTILLRNADSVPLSHETVRREIAFYLLAGAHTSATAFTRTMHNLFVWLDSHPDDGVRVREDRLFVQRATHETIRLQPSSPIGGRWATEDVMLASGRFIAAGDRVDICLPDVNRDRNVFGPKAGEFDPDRDLPPGVTRWGLSFGMGMHACIGQDLSAGVEPVDGEDPDTHLHGVVPVAVQTMFDHGCRPDLDDPPELDESTVRPYFGRYPVVFDAG